MNIEPDDHPRNTPLNHRLSYPLHKIVAAVARADTDGVVAALAVAGFTRDRITIVTADDIKDLGEPIGGNGLHRLLVLFLLSLGDDLDELEQARQELMSGYALVQVRVQGHDERTCAHAVLDLHGGFAMHYFGRWTITPLKAVPSTAEKANAQSNVR